MKFARAQMVVDDIWIVYNDLDAADLNFIKYDTVAGQFVCASHRVIADFPLLPYGSASCQAQPVLQNFSRDLRAPKAATIDVSDPSDENAIAVVAYSAAGSGSCAGDDELRIYKSADQGNTWTYELVTGCQNSVHATVAFAENVEGGSTPGLVHVMSLHEAGTGTFGLRLRPVRWRSTNNGASWSGTYVGSSQQDFPSVTGGACGYWGDYDGLVADTANNTMYYFWSDGDDEPSWIIRGKGVTP